MAYRPKTDQAWNMTSLIRPTSPSSPTELLEQQLACSGLQQQSLWSSGVNITPHQRGSNREGDMGLGRAWNKRVKLRFVAGRPFNAATLMTGKEDRMGRLLGCSLAAAVRVGGPPGEAESESRGRAGWRAGLPALSPAPACLDKTRGTCGGISMRHHTWRKRQLNPAPSTTGPGSTKSSQHLEWISGDAADFTAPSRLLLTLPPF